ncbi:alpha/beta hydrolase [Acinetobacter sp. XH1639]|uniref:alpha/beta fold hydrolase n=1 Tax=Acinetobacter sp. XH1639 TaxID=3157368 RepID=UPI0032B31E21
MTSQTQIVISNPVNNKDQFHHAVNGISLCYRTYGDSTATPLLLIAGLGLQLTYWPEAFIQGFVAQGYFVIAFDNRDIGRSSRINAKPPTLFRQLLRLRSHLDYDLYDMAEDSIGLIDHLGIKKFHIIGMSMGGMIAQTISAFHSSRVLSLTSIFSSTGARHVGQPAPLTLLMLAKKPAKTREQAIQLYLKMAKYISSPIYFFDRNKAQLYAGEAWDRGNGINAHYGVKRQIAAIIKSGDRTEQLRLITVPTLILHGEKDVLVHPSGGKATFEAIYQARHITVHGLGHYFSEGVIPQLLGLIIENMQRSLTNHHL